jgi:hypothetical protein
MNFAGIEKSESQSVKAVFTILNCWIQDLDFSSFAGVALVQVLAENLILKVSGSVTEYFWE